MLKRKRMELTELFSGFRNKRQKRMVQLRETNGLAQVSTWETGVITVKKALVFSTIRMGINMKACGHSINVMVKELTGVWKTKNSDVNILVIGLKTRNMAEELSFTKMETATTVTGLMAYLRVKVE
jgi:hypothetical protein